MMLVSIRGGTWVLEQPGSSVLEYYPAWLHFLNAYYQVYGMETVGTSAQPISNFQELSRESKNWRLLGYHMLSIPGPQSNMVDVPLRGTKSETTVGLGQ